MYVSKIGRIITTLKLTQILILIFDFYKTSECMCVCVCVSVIIKYCSHVTGSHEIILQNK